MPPHFHVAGLYHGDRAGSMHSIWEFEPTLIWETVEVGGGWDGEAQGERGALVSNDQVLVGPVMAGHLPKQQLWL